MSDLYINLPTINEKWVEKHLTELLTDGTNFLHDRYPQDMEYSIGVLGFAEAFENITDRQREDFYLRSDQEMEATKEAEKHIKELFKVYGLWDKKVCTIEQVYKYNEALKEIIFYIADDYARGWAKYLGVLHEDAA